MVRQHYCNCSATLQGCCELADVALHIWAVGSQARTVNIIEGMGPEVLVLQIDKVLCIAQRVCIELGNVLDTVLWSETVGVCWDCTGYLHQAVACYWRRERVYGNEQLVVPLVSLDDIIPALAKIEFHVPHCRSFDDSVSIMPVVRGTILFVAAQRRGVVMGVRIPAVKIATQFNQRIDASNEGMSAVHDR